jgi:hypothetical protein
MRYTGEEKKEERKEAADHVKGLWGKVRGATGLAQEAEPSTQSDQGDEQKANEVA